jgi:hypothetical protein
MASYWLGCVAPGCNREFLSDTSPTHPALCACCAFLWWCGISGERSWLSAQGSRRATELAAAVAAPATTDDDEEPPRRRIKRHRPGDAYDAWRLPGGWWRCARGGCAGRFRASVGELANRNTHLCPVTARLPAAGSGAPPCDFLEWLGSRALALVPEHFRDGWKADERHLTAVGRAFGLRLARCTTRFRTVSSWTPTAAPIVSARGWWRSRRPTNPR